MLNKFLLSLAFCLIASLAIGHNQNLERLSYNNPDLLVDLGVGLWGWPLPMDYNNNGLTDLVVASTANGIYNGVYLFENTGITDTLTNLPVFKAARRLGKAVRNPAISYIDEKPVITTPGYVYPDFKNTVFENPDSIPAPVSRDFYPEGGSFRGNHWRYFDYNGNGIMDLLVGIGYWGKYGWDNAYNDKGQWTRGPLHGHVFLLLNNGTNENTFYEDPVRLMDTDGKPIDVFGRPLPNFADFTGNGKPDLICGEFRDGFTFFENVGTRNKPLFAPGRPLINGDKHIRMDLCMITPVAYDFTGNGWPDLVVGDEDGRVALVEHTGKMVDGMPLFLPPRYFRQQADEVKFGVCVTPVGIDWNGNGRDDIIAGNTAGQIGFIENLGGNPVKWDAPKLLEAGGEIIQIIAGANGSIQGPAESKWGYTTPTVADWNNNGLPDIIVNSIWGKIIWYENIGTRTKPELAAARPIDVEWEGEAPKPAWNWWDPQGNELVTQWRTTPVAVDWTGNGLTDLVMLDHEGYLALFRREMRDGKLILLPGERVFQIDWKHLSDEPLRLSARKAGGSGRRKLAIADIDGDGRLDLLLQTGQNSSYFRNLGEVNGITVFRDKGPVDELTLGGHTPSPTVIDLDGDGVPEFLIGAEDGFLYYKKNNFTEPGR